MLQPAWLQRLGTLRRWLWTSGHGGEGSPKEFFDATIEVHSGEQVCLRLAEGGTLPGGMAKVREVRKLGTGR